MPNEKHYLKVSVHPNNSINVRGIEAVYLSSEEIIRQALQATVQ